MSHIEFQRRFDRTEEEKIMERRQYHQYHFVFEAKPAGLICKQCGINDHPWTQAEYEAWQNDIKVMKERFARQAKIYKQILAQRRQEEVDNT